MTFSPNDPDHDAKLIAFLQKYKASPPPPAQGLENRIITACNAQPRSYRWLWIPALVSVIAALSWSLAPRPGALTASEQAELESFLQSTWIEVTEGIDVTGFSL